MQDTTLAVVHDAHDLLPPVHRHWSAVPQGFDQALCRTVQKKRLVPRLLPTELFEY